MRYLGIDYGEKRIGLAYADDLGLALPLPAAVKNTTEERFAQIGEIIKQRCVETLVVGYPLNMDGTVGFKALEVDAFIQELERRFGLPIHRTDERLTSRQAQADLQAAGKKKPRSVKQHRANRATGEIDSRAAALLLQDYIDSLTLDADNGFESSAATDFGSRTQQKPSNP